MKFIFSRLQNTSKLLLPSPILPYDSLDEIRDRIDNLNPTVTNYDVFNQNRYIPSNVEKSEPIEGTIGVTIKNYIDYFMTCPITRASGNMANCVKSASEMDYNQQYIEEAGVSSAAK